MFVKPADRDVNGGPLKVRDPVSKLHIPAEGKDVPENSFWIRRLRAGDVVRCDPPAPAGVTDLAEVLGIPAEVPPTLSASSGPESIDS